MYLFAWKKKKSTKNKFTPTILFVYLGKNKFVYLDKNKVKIIFIIVR